MMKIDGGCHCGYITYEAEIDPDKTLICHCTTARRYRVPRSASSCTPAKMVSSCFRANRKSTSRPAKAGISGHNRSARNVERTYTRRRSVQDPRFTPFEWVQFVSAIKSPPMCKYGLAR